MNKKKFFVACISCCNAFLGLFFFAIAGPLTVICAEDDMPKETPVLETTGVELLATRLGKLDVTVKASQMRQYESGNIELTGGITVVVFGDPSDQGEGPTHIQANSLFYNKVEALCTIAGGVVVTKPESELEIKTEQLCYDIKKEVIFTEIPVVIVHKDLTLKGDALRATKDLTKYTITGPSGSVDIQQEAVLEANRL